MASRRYTILIADRTSGVVRRVTISARPAVAVACAMVTLPVLIGVGAAWKAKSDVDGLYSSQQALEPKTPAIEPLLPNSPVKSNRFSRPFRPWRAGCPRPDSGPDHGEASGPREVARHGWQRHTR